MVDQPMDLEERLEAMQDEINLLKNEVKQTLIDLREFIMKDRSLQTQVVMEPSRSASARAPGAEQAADGQVAFTPPMPGYPQGFQIPALAGVRRPGIPGAPLRDLQSEAHASGALDAVMLGNIIWWLGTVKRRGLSLQQITPYLEAYEMSGHLTPSMAKLILRSMAELDDREEVQADRVFSPHDYADCLLQLHDIICTPGYQVDRLVPPVVLRPEVSAEKGRPKAEADHSEENAEAKEQAAEQEKSQGSRSRTR